MNLNLEKSLDMQIRAKFRIPGMTQLLSKRPDMFAPGVWPGYYSKAKGAEVWDLDGNRYIDMSITGTISLGCTYGMAYLWTSGFQEGFLVASRIIGREDISS